MKVSDPHASGGFSLVELVFAVFILVMLTGAISPALMQYVEKGRVRRDTQSIEMLYNAVSSALVDEIAYDSLKAGMGADGVYSSPIDAEKLFLMDDGFSEAVRDYMPTAPVLMSKKARGKDGRYQIMVSVSEKIDADTGIRSIRPCVWAGNAERAAGADLISGDVPDWLKTEAAEG
ncbi:MAG: prepilin-type N-terminal cleavage/methylation domain-containing protein [Lachnospiraceae bacterium]|nr:prepilin-type N-terminal cleavage/methylation domain-containing protein [Lachnospiraceae bacterium]